MTHTLAQIESSWKNTSNVRVMCKLHFPIKNYGNRKRTEKNSLFAQAETYCCWFWIWLIQETNCFVFPGFAILISARKFHSDFLPNSWNVFSLADSLKLWKYFVPKCEQVFFSTKWLKPLRFWPVYTYWIVVQWELWLCKEPKMRLFQQGHGGIWAIPAECFNRQRGERDPSKNRSILNKLSGRKGGKRAMNSV